VSPVFRWIALFAATAAVAVALDRVGLPSASLFAALLVGLAAALLSPRVPEVSPAVFRAAQAITGASLGVYVQSSSLSAVANAWLPVGIVSAATLALSLLCGWALVKTVHLDPPTAALGMIAGERPASSGWRGSSGRTTGSSRSCSTCACSSWSC